jgi:cytoskeleton protein RodZ
VRPAAQGTGLALSTFGAWLRQSRELRGLTLPEVATSTRLSERIVAALEADDFAALQDRAHALLVARACAVAIGLDPEDTALRLEEALGPAADATPSRSHFLPREPLVWAILALTLCICTFLLLKK